MQEEKQLEDFSIEEVKQWLKSKNLEEFAEKFEGNRPDPNVALSMFYEDCYRVRTSLESP